MGVLIRLAFRNIWEHKTKSIIIGVLVALGVMILIIGNAMMDAAERGMRESYIESFTGDVMISGKSEDDTLSIFGYTSEMFGMNETKIPVVPSYETVLSQVAADPRVQAATSMATAYSLLSISTDEDPLSESESDWDGVIFGMLFGVDPDSYFSAFPALVLEKGRLLEKGKRELMMTKEQCAQLEKKYGRPFGPGDKILVNGFGPGGMRIRELTLVGIYRRGNIDGDAPMMLCDIDTVRVLGGLTLGADESVEVGELQTALLEEGNPDDLFSEDALPSGMVDAPAVATKADFSNLSTVLGDTSRREALNTADSGAWNFLLIRLKDSGDTKAVIADYSQRFKSQGIDIQVTDWKGASGLFGRFADFVRIAFDIVVFLIVVVAIIIMMNTLVISVIERTSEIGTMRALGAQRSFIRKLFLTETLTLTAFFGLIGSAIAVALLGLLNALHIGLENDFAQLLLGGKVFHLVPSVQSFALTLVAVFLVGWLAHLYPVSVALKVQPVRAMQSE